MAEDSVVTLIAQALHQGDSLVFRKNPLCYLDSFVPGASDISITLNKYIPGSGNSWFTATLNMEVVKDQDSFVVNEIMALSRMASKAQDRAKEHKHQRVYVGKVLHEALRILEERQESPNVTCEYLARIIGTIFLQQTKGEQNAETETTND